MNRDTRRFILGSAAGIASALAARYALTHQQPARRLPVRPQPAVKNAPRRPSKA